MMRPQPGLCLKEFLQPENAWKIIMKDKRNIWLDGLLFTIFSQRRLKAYRGILGESERRFRREKVWKKY